MDDAEKAAKRAALEAQLADLDKPEDVTGSPVLPPSAPWSGPPSVRPEPIVPPVITTRTVQPQETGLDTIEENIEKIPEEMLSATFRGVSLGTWLARLEAIFSTHFASTPTVATSAHVADEKEAA